MPGNNSNEKQFEVEKDILREAYSNFNKKDIDSTLKTMHKDVEWPNGMEGGIEYGHLSVRNYWTRQWSLIDPHVEPVKFDREKDGRIKVTVHQVVHDLDGNLLVDQTIHHIYQMEGDLIKSMEIRS